jgi:transcriptional regulator with XRE-family HTH domain
MTKDWAAVATALNHRMTELGVQQHELVARSRVSRSAVWEIRHNTAQRRRSARTLEALSVALGWHPQHLVAVLEGRSPPQVGDPVTMSNRDGDVVALLTAIDRKLSQINDRFDRFEAAWSDRIEAIKGKD